MAKSYDDLGIQKQLNSLFNERLGTETRILNTMQQELKIALQLKSVMSDLSKDDLEDRLNKGAEAFKKITQEAETAGSTGAKALKAISEEAKKSKEKSANFASVFTGLGGIFKSLVTTAGGFTKSIFNIGKALLSIPLGIFKNLMADAASAGGDTSFLQALEDIRKEFGSFKEGTSKDILGAYTTLNTQLQQVSGLSVWQVFDKPADQLKYLQEVASKAGSQILQFGTELQKSSGIIATFDKGMGIGAENMKAMMNRATVFGTTLTKQLNDTANYALKLGKDFGISSKIISREVGTMMKDVRNFGSLTQKEMTVAAVYTKKLGLEMKDLTGLVDKFDNFDKASESAALLSQAFGATVDAFKLMNEQDPAKRLDELRKSLQATGKSTENMTRQELHLLAQTSGLSDEAAKLAFSTKNQGLSYDQVQKQANKAELAQIKQADALAKLADNIERVVRSGGQMEGSFFKMFFAGMERGIKWSDNYRGAMYKVRQSLMETFMAGRKVGVEFAQDKTLGFGKFMFNFGETFSPKNVRKVLYGFKDEAGKQMGGVVQEMTAVFKGNQSVAGALANIRKTFNMAVDQNALKNMMEGGKDMMRFLAKGIGSGSSFMAKELTSVLKTITDFIKNPKEFLEKAKAGGAGASSVGAELVRIFADSFGDPKVLKDLGAAATNFAKVVFVKVKDAFKSPEVQKGIMEVAGPLLTGLFGRGLLSLAPTVISKAAPALVRLFSTGIGSAFAGAAGIALVGSALVNVNKKMDAFEAGIDKRRDPASKKMGALGASLLQGLTLGLVPDNIAMYIGDKIASLSDALFESVQSKMGGPFTSKLKKLFSSNINFFSSVGGLIGAVFSGDSSAISKEAERVGNSLVTLAGTAFDFFVTEFPKLLVKIPGIIDNIVGSISVGIGNSLVKLGDKMGFLGGSVKTLGFILIGAGETFKSIGKIADDFFEKIKNVDFSAEVGKRLDQLKLKFVEFGVGVLQSIPKPIAYMFGINDEMKSKMLNNLNDMGESIKKSLASIATAERESQSKTDAIAAAARMKGSKMIALDTSAKDVSPSGDDKGLSNDVSSLMLQKKTLEENLKDLQKFADAGVVKSISESIPKASVALTEFNDKLSKSGIESTINVTQGVVKSMNELHAALGDGNVGAIKVAEKLQRFANASGLGKSGTYEIKNKGIVLKLDLKVTMDAGEVEKAMLMRRDSIIFDAIEESASTNLNETNKERLRALRGGA